MTTVTSRGQAGESSQYTSKMRVVDGALIQVDEEGNEILKTPVKEKAERTCSVAERKMWDDLSTSVWSVFETILDSDSVTKDFKDKDGGLEVLTSTLNHLNQALHDKSSISWWTHLIQVRKLLKLITKTHETCIVPSLQSKTLSRNSKLMIAKRYKRLCAAEKYVIELLCSVNRLSCEKEENTNNMNAVRHVLYVVFEREENFNQPHNITCITHLYHKKISRKATLKRTLKYRKLTALRARTQVRSLDSSLGIELACDFYLESCGKYDEILRQGLDEKQTETVRIRDRWCVRSAGTIDCNVILFQDVQE